MHVKMRRARVCVRVCKIEESVSGNVQVFCFSLTENKNLFKLSSEAALHNTFEERLDGNNWRFHVNHQKMI